MFILKDNGTFEVIKDVECNENYQFDNKSIQFIEELIKQNSFYRTFITKSPVYYKSSIQFFTVDLFDVAFNIKEFNILENYLNKKLEFVCEFINNEKGIILKH